ncbi:hypothetical protein Dimus_015061 [Dionaea muscipula]
MGLLLIIRNVTRLIPSFVFTTPLLSSSLSYPASQPAPPPILIYQEENAVEEQSKLSSNKAVVEEIEEADDDDDGDCEEISTSSWMQQRQISDNVDVVKVLSGEEGEEVTAVGAGRARYDNGSPLPPHRRLHLAVEVAASSSPISCRYLHSPFRRQPYY